MLAYRDEDELDEIIHIDMIAKDWEHDIKPLLRRQPEEGLKILIWARLMVDTERPLESASVPTKLAHIVRLDDQGFPELIPQVDTSPIFFFRDCGEYRCFLPISETRFQNDERHSLHYSGAISCLCLPSQYHRSNELSDSGKKAKFGTIPILSVKYLKEDG